MDKAYQLARLLADGKFHSGEDLAARAGVSRTAVWKQAKRLAALPGIRLDAVKGRGYRLREPLELLDAQRLLAGLGADERAGLEELHVLSSVDSTNRFLLDRPRPRPGAAAACVAELQTRGRGRNGRSWTSTFGRNIYLSLDRVFELPLAELAGISLAAGVALARTLGRQGLEGHCLKWPNDVHVGQRKLAGVLVEASGETGGPARTVIGIGINLRVEPEDAGQIDQPWTDLAAAMTAPPSRNRLAADLLNALLGACAQYQVSGLSPFLDEWSEYDRYQGQPVELLMGDRVIRGRYRGLDGTGNCSRWCRGSRPRCSIATAPCGRCT